MVVKWHRFGPDVGDEVEEISEDAALKRVNKGLREGKLLIVKTTDGQTITSAEVAHERDSVAAKAAETETKKKVKKVLREKKVESVTEIAPVAGG